MTARRPTFAQAGHRAGGFRPDAPGKDTGTPRGVSQEDASTTHVETRRFEAQASEIGRARRFVRAVLSARGLGSLATPFDLMVSELVTNAIVHGVGAVEVTVAVEGTSVHLDVHDSGSGDLPVRVEDTAASEPGGWGLAFVDRLADDWGTVVDAEGTSVWLVKRAEDT